MKNRFFYVVLAALLLFFVAGIQAQTVASITGTVTDKTGAVIPGVSVTLENPLTGVVYHATTNSVGSYTIVDVAPGPGYKVDFAVAGFKPFEVTDVYMNVDTTRTQNAKLVVGGGTETVHVSASAENLTLNTTDATVGNNFEVQVVNELPVQFRDTPSALLTLQPGVTLDGAVTGARTDQNNITLDGLEVNDNATGQFGAIVGNAPVDSVQEFRGVTANPLASSGQGGGGQFEMVTKSGTNKFHGNINEYHRDTDLEANNWFNKNDGVGRPPLIRNQFGGNIGGPIKRDKAFFFFDYNGRHDTISSLVTRTVPMDNFRSGTLAYCNSLSTSNNCVQSTLSGSQVAALDPNGIGFDASELSLMTSRYPHANDLSGDAGDLVNTAGYRFNAPTPVIEKNYVGRVDYNLSATQKLFGRVTFIRENATENPIQFPGDPETYPFQNKSYAYVIGHTWQIGNNKVNQAYYGLNYENYSFDVTYNPQGANQYSYSGLSGPYGGGSNSQARTYPVPVVRDDFTWNKGRHNISFGGTFKWESPSDFAAENYNFVNIGVSGNTNLLNAPATSRPSDISSDWTTVYDSLFTTALGAVADVASNFNYNKAAVPLTQGSGLSLKYRYYETEAYFGDTWHVTPQLAISYGVRYQNYTVPYEVNGEESSPSYVGTGNGKLSFDNYFGDRVAQSQAGNWGNDVVPFIQYTLGGKANNAPGYYQGAKYNFAPRIALAYNPKGSHDVFNIGAGLIYDHSIINAIQFQQLQTSYLFEASATNFSSGPAGGSLGVLENGPRFAGLTSPPPPPSAPNVTTPYVPFVDPINGPYGLAASAFNIMVDPTLKTPYNIQFSAGYQHEFGGGFILKMNYVGRLGRRLLAQADGSQLIDFPDATGLSNQSMGQAMGVMTQELRAGASLGALNDIFALTPQPWFEDMIGNFCGLSATQCIAYYLYPLPQRGDFADTIQGLAAFGLLPPNVGMDSQFSSNTFWTNKGFSGYHGLLVNLHKNAGYGLQFDLNYTWSHSIDNVSVIANSIAGSNGYGFICDVRQPRACRGNSDFDVKQNFNGDFLYALPFGRGRQFGATMPRWADEVVGGWSLSGLPEFHTGNAYNATSNAYVAGYANNAPATLIGNGNYLKTKVNGGGGNRLYAYADPTTALSQLTGPTGFAFGSRNPLYGPHYFNTDLGIGKTFPLYKELVNLKFRCDAFNAFNHASFNNPVVDITQASGTPFGTITSTSNAARVLQGSLRIEF